MQTLSGLSREIATLQGSASKLFDQDGRFVRGPTHVLAARAAPNTTSEVKLKYHILWDGELMATLAAN